MIDKQELLRCVFFVRVCACVPVNISLVFRDGAPWAGATKNVKKPPGKKGGTFMKLKMDQK